MTDRTSARRIPSTRTVASTIGTVWAQPILRWAGSKRQLVPNLLPLLPNRFGKYYEPFAGSACLFFAIHPSNAVLGDLNADLIQAYEMLVQHPRKLARQARHIGASGLDYYGIRAMNPQDLDPMTRAARFIYLNRNCFNGLYRTNRLGAFNVPLGTKTGLMPAEDQFYRCAFALRGVQLRAVDYSKTIADAQSGDFVYMDPPYKTARRNHGEYGYGIFSEVDLVRFAEDARRLDKVGATVLISYAVDRRLVRLLAGWNKITVKVRRRVAGAPAHRTVAREMILTNLA
jgi:DNA adenine methylase